MKRQRHKELLISICIAKVMHQAIQDDLQLSSFQSTDAISDTQFINHILGNKDIYLPKT